MALVGSTSLPTLPSLGLKQRLPRRAATPPTTRSAEAQLRAARVDIEREKLRAVVDHPFFNCLRFKELEMRQITLEFTGDGRFAYCERHAWEKGPMTIYEGVLMKTTGEKVKITTTEDKDEDELEQQDTSGPSAEKQELSDCAFIEGRATVRYDRSQGDFPVLSNVERGDFRFAITVKPCFKSPEMEAWVQPSMAKQTRKHLALVDDNGDFTGETFGNKKEPEAVSSRPMSRSGFSSSLYLERLVAKPPRASANQRQTASRGGFGDSLGSSFSTNRTRPVRKIPQSQPMSELRPLKD